MYEYYDYYKKSAGDFDKQERWARQLIWEVARHAVGEEIVVYPLMEKHMGEEGKRLADEDREQHQVSSFSPSQTAFPILCLSSIHVQFQPPFCTTNALS